MSANGPFLLAALLAGLAVPGGLRAQPEEPRTGQHIVRPGESLIGITRSYLGSSERWRENWQLNPDVADPHRLSPGQRIRILLPTEPSRTVARLKTVAGRVEERPAPIPWNEAREDDLLVERDGLRTGAKSSSELEWTDGTSLAITEKSLIFLPPPGRRLTARPRRSVEIVEGQAEVQALEPGAPRAEVEIVVGAARAISRGGEEGVAQARARRPEGGGAAIMVYEGAGEVESAGARVEVPRGMGTAVPENRPPPPPEKLLPAPRIRQPQAGSEWQVSALTFGWHPVPGAERYTVEICRDARCAELVDRVTAVAGTEWRPPPLPLTSFFWRATAVSPSGLDGYPSVPAAFTVVADVIDDEPPTVRVSVRGEGREVGGVTFYPGEVRVEVEVEDALTGVESWTVRIDGAEAGREDLRGPWTSGEHTVAVSARDGAGNRTESEPVAFRVDADPPRIRFEVGGDTLLDDKVAPGLATRKWSKRKRKWARRAGRRFDRSLSGPVWTVLAWGDDGSSLRDSYRPRTVLRSRQRVNRVFGLEGDRPEVLLLAVRLATPDAAGAGPGGEEALVWLRAEDGECGVVRGLTLRTEEGTAAGSPPRLAIEAADAMGNRARLEWPFRVGS